MPMRFTGLESSNPFGTRSNRQHKTRQKPHASKGYRVANKRPNQNTNQGSEWREDQHNPEQLAQAQPFISFIVMRQMSGRRTVHAAHLKS